MKITFSNEPYIYQGPLKFEHSTSRFFFIFNLILIDLFPVGREEVMQKAAALQGCPVPEHWRQIRSK